MVVRPRARGVGAGAAAAAVVAAEGRASVGARTGRREAMLLIRAVVTAVERASPRTPRTRPLLRGCHAQSRRYVSRSGSPSVYLTREQEQLYILFTHTTLSDSNHNPNSGFLPPRSPSRACPLCAFIYFFCFMPRGGGIHPRLRLGHRRSARRRRERQNPEPGRFLGPFSFSFSYSTGFAPSRSRWPSRLVLQLVWSVHLVRRCVRFVFTPRRVVKL